MSDLVALVRPLVEGWERGDFRPRPELFADDIVVTGFTPAGEDRAQGPAAIAGYLRQFFAEWREYRISVERIETLDDRHVVVHGASTGSVARAASRSTRR